MGVFRNLSLPAVLFAGLSTAPASAGTIALFKLFDHGGGQLGPNYGVRVDSAGRTDDSDDGSLFSGEDGANDSRVMLSWNLDTGVATIAGMLRTIVPGGLPNPNEPVLYTPMGVVALGPDPEDGFTATSGMGSIDGFLIVGQLGDSGRASCGDDIVFCVAPDGHRADPFDADELVGTGVAQGFRNQRLVGQASTGGSDPRAEHRTSLGARNLDFGSAITQAPLVALHRVGFPRPRGLVDFSLGFRTDIALKNGASCPAAVSSRSRRERRSQGPVRTRNP